MYEKVNIGTVLNFIAMVWGYVATFSGISLLVCIGLFGMNYCISHFPFVFIFVVFMNIFYTSIKRRVEKRSYDLDKITPLNLIGSVLLLMLISYAVSEEKNDVLRMSAISIVLLVSAVVFLYKRRNPSK